MKIKVKGTTLDVINLKGYPYALFVGAAIALFILYSLPVVTTELNPRFPWKNNWVVRLVFQFLFGIMVPFMIVMFFISWYFWIVGFWILETGWLEYYSATILAMLFFLNIFNELFAELSSKANNIHAIESEDIESSETNLFRGRSYKDVVYINSNNRKNTIMFTDGTEFPYQLSIEFARKMLSESTHLLAKRGQIVSLASINRAKWVDGKRLRLQVFLTDHENFEVIFSEVQTVVHRELLKQFIGSTN